MYLAIKMHFTNESYDFFKYNGVVRSSQTKFDTRKDKYFFYKLSKNPDLKMFLACNLRVDPSIWVGNLFDEKCKQRYQQSQKVLQSLQYEFEKDLARYDDLNDALVPKKGNQSPDILSDYHRGEVNAESLVVLNDTLKVFDYWDQCFDGHVVWKQTRDNLTKYGKFMNYDVKKFQKILLDNHQVVA